jgi:hypothetical protein
MKHWKGLEGARSWFVRGATLIFAKGTRGNRPPPKKSSASKASILAEI